LLLFIASCHLVSVDEDGGSARDIQAFCILYESSMLMLGQRTRLLHSTLLRPCRSLPASHSAARLQLIAPLSSSPPRVQSKPDSPKPASTGPRIELHENIYTIPNALTVSRIIACPFLGYFIVKGDFVNATWLLAYAGISDWVRVTVLRVETK
jgi:cardiolipin synthase